jgi:hypothetical protein
MDRSEHRIIDKQHSSHHRTHLIVFIRLNFFLIIQTYPLQDDYCVLKILLHMVLTQIGLDDTSIM